MVTTAAGLNLIRCASGTAVVGIDVSRVIGVERGERLDRRPAGTAPGRLSTRDGDWAVFPLSRWLGPAAAPPAAGGQVIGFDTPRGKLGLLVERVSPVERVPAARVGPAPDGTGTRSAGLISCVVISDAGPTVVLDVLRLDAAGGRAPEAHPRSLPAVATVPVRTDRLLTFGRTEYPRPGGRAVVLAIPVGLVAEVFDAPPGTPVPAAEDHVREMVVWRDRPLVLLDPARWVGLPARESGSRRTVVATIQGQQVGLAAGAGVQVVPASTPCVPSRRSIPLDAARVHAVLDATDQTLVIPAWDRFLSPAARTR